MRTAATYDRPARRAASNALGFALAILFTLVFLALGYVSYMMWPRWPEAPIAADAPLLPVVIGEITFQIPPGAIRRKVQRHAGAHDRIDLVYLWPQLTPAAVMEKDDAEPPPVTSPRLFVTIAMEPAALSSSERLKIIYPRYMEPPPVDGPDGLALVPFRDATPYQGEDLLFDRASPDNFLVRCTRDGPSNMPGMCLDERLIGSAHITMRFPRTWLSEWHNVAAQTEQLLLQWRPSGG